MARYAAEIIREAGAGPLAFVSLGLLTLAYLSARWFGRDHVGVRLAIFAALFMMIGLTAFIVTQQGPAPKADEKPVAEAPADARPAPGAARAETPPPSQPRPVAPPLSRFEQAINDGVFVIRFGHDSTVIAEGEAGFLDDIADEIARRQVGRVTVAGHTDRWGSATYNVGRSERLANAVRDYLVERGVPAATIVTEAWGESRPVADTPDGDPNADNRRVEIRFG